MYVSIAALIPALDVLEVPEAELPKTIAPTLVLDGLLFGFANTTTPSAAPAATNGTYVSNKYQDLLLYGCLVEAYGYLKGPGDMLQYYEQAYQRALQSYSIEQQGRRRRDEWQDGVIRTGMQSESPSKY